MRIGPAPSPVGGVGSRPQEPQTAWFIESDPPCEVDFLWVRAKVKREALTAKAIELLKDQTPDPNEEASSGR